MPSYMDAIGAIFLETGEEWTKVWAYRRAVRLTCFHTPTIGNGARMLQLMDRFVRANPNGIITKFTGSRGIIHNGEEVFNQIHWVTILPDAQHYGIIGYTEGNPVSLYVDSVPLSDATSMVVMQWGRARQLGVVDRYRRLEYWRDDAIFCGPPLDM